MRVVIISFLLLLSSFQLYGQNVILYSYDSAGNRTHRDTTSTNVALLSAVGSNTLPKVSIDLLPFAATLGEVVFSDGRVSPEPLASLILLEEYGPIKTQLHQTTMSKESLRKLYSIRKHNSVSNNTYLINKRYHLWL